MSNIDWSVITSGVVAIAAIISPIITTVVNNFVQTKIFKQKMYTKHSIDTIDAYIAAAGSYLRFGSYGEIAELSGKIYLHVPEKYWNDIEELNRFIFAQPSNARDIETGLALVTKISRELSEYTSKLRKR